MDTPTEALRNWHRMNRYLGVVSEEQCWELLDAERTGRRRTHFLIRIYGRANKLRAIRERDDLLAGGSR